MKIRNSHNELLDVLVEGNKNSNKILLFAHGLGTDKDEGKNLFRDISQALRNDFRIIRFDFSAYGKSEGKEEESSIAKTASDLGVMVDYIKKNFKGDYYLIAHSMGTYATGKLNPTGFKKIVLTGIPNDTTKCSLERIAERIKSRQGGMLNKMGISTYPRSSGFIQRIGPNYWIELEKFDPTNAMKILANKTDLYIIHPLQDEIIGNDNLDGYKTISNAKYIEIDGDHSWSNKEERAELIKLLKRILLVSN